MIKTPFNPLISIIVPCYNQGNFLADALESLLAQTYPHWECQIIDDGSTDNTKTVAQGYLDKDSRFKYTYRPNSGLSAARNQGLKIATGEYIQFLDADDLIAPSKFETQLTAFELNPDADIVYCEYLCFDNQDRKNTWTYSRVHLKNDVLLDFITGWENGLSIPIHCFLYKKNCFERWGLFDESLIYGKEDWDLHLQFALNKAKFIFTSGVMAFYRQGTNSMTKNIKKMERGKQKIFYKYLLASKIPIRTKIIFMKRGICDRISSWKWKLLNFGYKIKDRLFPKGSCLYNVAKIFTKRFKMDEK